jgi:hypothetical protein
MHRYFSTMGCGAGTHGSPSRTSAGTPTAPQCPHKVVYLFALQRTVRVDFEHIGDFSSKSQNRLEL